MKLIIFLIIFAGADLFAGDPKDEVFQSMKAGHFSESDYDKLKQGADENYFGEMDKGLTLAPGSKRSDGQPFPEDSDVLYSRVSPYLPGMSKEEILKRAILGRNNWMVFTGGNDRFWDHFNEIGFGGIDLLKTISNHPEASTSRGRRWEKLGLVNEPCFKDSGGPRKDRYGLWLDVRDPGCPLDPFENEEKYPGVKIGSRGEELYVGVGEVPIDYVSGSYERMYWLKEQAKKKGVKKTLHEVGSSYGYATGIIGLRLFPNPEFDDKAAARWDADKYYNDLNYYNDPNLKKPYRVGMACAFCHVGPSPVHPPSDFNNPQWENLSSTVGSQYFWVDRILFWNYRKSEDNFVHQLLHTQRPGTLDTSLVSSDQINNSRTMNAVYDLRARLKVAMDFQHNERLEGAQRFNKHFSDMSFVPDNSPVLKLEVKKGVLIKDDPFGPSKRVDYVTVPRILKDGSDSATVLGSLNRVYINIGLYSEEWLRNFVPLLGTFDVPFFKISPFEIKVAQKNSGYWNANTEQTPNLGLFLLGGASADHLKNAPKGQQYLQDYQSAEVERGKEVFAKNCASCHSSKLPLSAAGFFNKKGCIGKGYLNCWENFWNHVNSNDRYQYELLEIVKKDDFLQGNFLSTELRVPVNVVGTQVCSSLATNALKNDIWDNFSSASYKELPAISDAEIYEPTLDGESYVRRKVALPGGGRGYLRPPSLISLWSTAPFFNNNTLGPFHYQGTLEARMTAFNQSMSWLLDPSIRGVSKKGDGSEHLVSYDVNGQLAKGVVDVLSKDSYVSIPAPYVPRIIFDVLPQSWKQKYPVKYHYDGKKFIRYRKNAEAKTRPHFFTRTYKSIVAFFSGKQSGRSVSGYDDEYGGDSAEYIVPNDEKQNRIYIGPIPKGVPINLISNINFESPKSDIIKALLSIKNGIEAAGQEKGESQRLKAFMSVASQKLLQVSKCSDFIVNKGHYFGTGYEYPGAKALSDGDKKALTEFMKHF